MGKMTITAYTDDSFSCEYKSALDLPINPSKVKLNKESVMRKTSNWAA